jgi:hypothetical protein
LPDPNRVFEATKRLLAAVVKKEAFAGDKFTDDVGNKDFAAFGECGNAGSGDDGRAEEVVVFGDGFACVNADTNADSVGKPVKGFAQLFVQGLLERNRTFEGALGRRERSEKAISHRLDFASPVGAERLARDALVFAQKLATPCIPEEAQEVAVAFDIGEQDRAEGGAAAKSEAGAIFGGRDFEDETSNGFDDGLIPGERRRTSENREAGVRNRGDELAGTFDLEEGRVHPMKDEHGNFHLGQEVPDVRDRQGHVCSFEFRRSDTLTEKVRYPGGLGAVVESIKGGRQEISEEIPVLVDLPDQR